MSLELDKLSDLEIIKLYRKETEANRDKIIRYLLYIKRVKGKTWDQKIWTCVNFNKSKLSIDASCDEDDLYQEAIKAFHNTLDRLFKVENGYSLSTYLWPAINCAINRVFQRITKTKKRKALKDEMEIEINLQYDNNKHWADIISTQNVGNYRSRFKEDDFETILFYKDIIEHLKKNLVHEKIDANKELIEEIVECIRNKRTNDSVFRELTQKFNVKFDYIINVKNAIARNIEKSMYRDFMNSFEYNLKNKEALATKYNCSKVQLTKQIEMMGKKFRMFLKKMNLPCNEIFS